MVRRGLWLGIALLFIVGLLPAVAQDTGWTAWLFNQTDGRMTQVNQNGQVLDDFFLPSSSGFDLYPRLVAVGRGGSPFAYVAVNSSTFQGQLIVANREIITAAFTLPLTFASSMEFVADESIFNEDNSALAMGYSLDGGGWGIIILDLLTGVVSHTIRHDTPTVSILGLDSGFGLTPVIRRFENRTVTFSLVQGGTEGAAEYPGYTWNIDSGVIASTTAYLSLDSDTLPATGEVIMSLPDTRLANQSTEFIFFQSNTLHVYDPLVAARFPFFNAQGLTLYWPHFIQNGELILAGASDSSGAINTWLLISRDGAEQGRLPDGLTIDDIQGVADGFIYTSRDFSPGAVTLLSVNTRDGLDAGVPIWISPTGAVPTIAWVGDSGFSAQAAPNYATWAILADPVSVSNSTTTIAPPIITPTPLLGGVVSAGQVTVAPPVMSGFLAVGRLATVQTTEGDQLNVRLQPSIQAENIIARLSAGTRVTLLDGPRSAEGFTWWKIRTSTGIEGWVVESVDDNGTRLQTLLPG